MGSAETWPKAEETGAWLADTVLPEFEWALGSARAGKAKAVLDERVAAVEAERAKAEKERERAKAEQKKAREKAKREKAKADKRAVREARTAARGAAAMAPVPDATEPAAVSEA
jgi:molecular chaperone GrpE (heat shock protein)